MNGLKFIRKQCNFSLSDFARRFDVSRQLVNMWELGKRVIPEARKEEMAEFFGISKEYFGEISEEQKEELLKKAMFRYREDGIETYRYKPDLSQEMIIAYFIPEREITLDEEYALRKQMQKGLVDKIDAQIFGPSQKSIRDQLMYINRGVSIYECVWDCLNYCYERPTPEKMPHYRMLLYVLEGVRRIWCGAEDPMLPLEEEWLQRLKELMDEVLTARPDFSKLPIVTADKKGDISEEKKKWMQMSVEERIRQAEEQGGHAGYGVCYNGSVTSCLISFGDHLKQE